MSQSFDALLRNVIEESVNQVYPSGQGSEVTSKTWEVQSSSLSSRSLGSK